jgi:hypothetical protein
MLALAWIERIVAYLGKNAGGEAYAGWIVFGRCSRCFRVSVVRQLFYTGLKERVCELRIVEILYQPPTCHPERSATNYIFNMSQWRGAEELVLSAAEGTPRILAVRHGVKAFSRGDAFGATQTYSSKERTP